MLFPIVYVENMESFLVGIVNKKNNNNKIIKRHCIFIKYIFGNRLKKSIKLCLLSTKNE